MRNSLAIFLLFASVTFAQGDGLNYMGSIRGKLFRDLSSNRQGLFESRPNQTFHYMFAPKQAALTQTPVACAIRLVEVPVKDIDPGFILKQSGRESGDSGIFMPARPICPPRQQ
jgi:hypothetical protein